jgi:hypothetical protein
MTTAYYTSAMAVGTIDVLLRCRPAKDVSGLPGSFGSVVLDRSLDSAS